MTRRHPNDSEYESDSLFYTKRATVRILTKPAHVAQLYRGGSAIQHQVVLRGLVLHQDGGDIYPLRFVHNRILSAAQQLRPGQIIEVTQGRFKEAFGTKKMELHIKRFHYPWDAPPV